MEDNVRNPLKVVVVSEGNVDNAYVAGDETGRDMALIKAFLEEGQECGTVVEALYEAFQACLTGKADSIDWALGIGSCEWYK